MTNLRDSLKNNVLIADGAIGTLLKQHDHTHGHGPSIDALNLSQPDQIRDYHLAYLRAGADVIQTNTYGANTLKLARYGLEKDIVAINQAGVRLAKEAIKIHGRGFLLGNIGGINAEYVPVHLRSTSLDDIQKVFREQLYLLLLEGVDGLLLETYYDLEELKTVLKIAREVTDIPIIANVSIHEVGILQDGTRLDIALQELADLGADVVGVNCQLGPYHMIKALEGVPLLTNASLAVYPNASLPTVEDGEIIYQTEPSYFKKYAERFRLQGAHLIGGCCGTTPAHIANLRKGLESTTPVDTKVVIPLPDEVVFTKPKKFRGKRLVDKVLTETTVLVELDPPRTLNTETFFKGVQALYNQGTDAVTISDNSLASPRISNLALAALIKERYNHSPLIHITTRDHNLVGLHAHVMGLHKLGIHDLLAITGDPTKVGDFPGASSVFDLRSVELVQLIKRYNDGLSYSGKSLGEKANFNVAAAFNPNIKKLQQAYKIIQRKIDYGADYFITQPVYDVETVHQLADMLNEHNITTPFFIGVMPLLSSRNAEFLHNEVPGIRLSDEVRDRMKQADVDNRSLEVGLEISKEIIDAILERFNGIYIITPFQRYEVSLELLHYAKKTAPILK